MMMILRKGVVFVLNSKGFAFGEAIQLLLVIVIFAVLSVVVYKAFSEVNDDLQSDPDLSTTAKAEIDSLHDRFPDTFDGAFITILGLLFLTGVVASLLVESHPAFIIVVIILMAFLMVAGGFMSNSWEEFMTDDELSSFGASFPMTSWVLSNLLLVIGVMTITFGGIIYFKQKI